ncbi:MAG TPA: hypothetical protein VMT59_14910, partial [Gaiellaceae bacterium]|nr:hypothetical protein [Gaiellaceae bacterium]
MASHLPASPTIADAYTWVGANLSVSRIEYAKPYALQPPASLAGAHRRALWALWRLNNVYSDDIKQTLPGSRVRAVNHNAAATGQLLGDWQSAWRDAGVPVCAGDGFSAVDAMRGAALSSVREAARWIDVYKNDNYPHSGRGPDRQTSSTDSGYSGMTIALLAQYDESLLQNHTALLRVSQTSYCRQSTGDGQTAFKNGACRDCRDRPLLTRVRAECRSLCLEVDREAER